MDEELIVPLCQLAPSGCIRATTDGGWRITFDLPGDKEASVVVAALGTLRSQNLQLKITQSGE